MKQFDLSGDQKAFKKELEVLAVIHLYDGPYNTGGLPELFGFAFGPHQERAELMMSHCGQDLNKEWASFMTNRNKAKSTEFKLRVLDMAS